MHSQSNSNKAIGTSNSGSNTTNSDSEGSDGELPFIAKQRSRKKQAAQRHPNDKATDNINTTNSIKNSNSASNKSNTTFTHQETVM
jgi:hypothetical protein